MQGPVMEDGVARTGATFDVTIERSKCVGSGNCVLHAEGVFDQDEQGFAIVVDLDARPEQIVEFAAASCPMAAIAFTRRSGDTGGEG